MSFRIPVPSCGYAARSSSRMALLLALVSFSAASLSATMEVRVELTGAQEVPAVDTQAHGQGTLKINDDGTVSGIVTTTNVAGTMAHIHQAPAGENGGVVIPLQQTEDGSWVLPDDAQLTAEQLERLHAGDMYFNVHSAAHPGGEVRGQIEP